MLFWSTNPPSSNGRRRYDLVEVNKEVLRLYTIRAAQFRSAAKNETVGRRSVSCRGSVLHRSSPCPQRGIRLRHKCLEYVLRPSMTEEWRALSRKEWHHLDAVAQQRRLAKGSEQF